MTRLSLLVALLCTLLSAPAIAQDSMDPELMAKLMELAQPAEEHELLARMAGEWTMSVKLYMAPGAPAMEVGGEIMAETILGGRFLAQKSFGSMMGEPFESFTLFGYDRRYEKYVMIGFDTMGTYYVTAEGQMNEDGTIVMTGHDTDPIVGTQDYEFHIEIAEDGSVQTEMHMSINGAESFKMVEWSSARK